MMLPRMPLRAPSGGELRLFGFSKDNLLFLTGGGYHFVVSYTLKRSKEEFRSAVLGDQSSWAVEEHDKKTGELLHASKVLRQNQRAKVKLSEEERVRIREERAKVKKTGSCTNVQGCGDRAHVHVTYSKKRADKDAGDRIRIIGRLEKKLEKPSQLKSSLRRGGNQYLQMDLDAKDFSLDEGKVKEAARYDGYYAVVTDRLGLTTEEVMEIYRGQWKIEESFRVLKTDLQARPVFVWTDNHIKGHFALCYLSWCLLRYLQYLMAEQGWEPVLSAEEIMRAISDPLVLLQGEYPKMVTTPTCVNQAYLDITNLLKLPKLRQNMTLTQFRSITKLNLHTNLSEI